MVNYKQISYMILIGVHSTMHLVHPNSYTGVQGLPRSARSVRAVRSVHQSIVITIDLHAHALVVNHNGKLP